MLLPKLVVLVRPGLKPKLKKMLSIIQKKMEQNENRSKSCLGLLQTKTTLLPKFNNFTLVCDDSLTI